MGFGSRFPVNAHKIRLRKRLCVLSGLPHKPLGVAEVLFENLREATREGRPKCKIKRYWEKKERRRKSV